MSRYLQLMMGMWIAKGSSNLREIFQVLHEEKRRENEVQERQKVTEREILLKHHCEGLDIIRGKNIDKVIDF